MTIQKILKEKGPMLSGRLASELMKSSVSFPATRQQISRAKEPVRKFLLGFKNNQSFVCLEEQIGTPEYWETLKESLKSSSKAYYALINTFVFHEGFMYKKQLPIYGFSPIKNLKGHLNANKIISDLVKTNLIMTFDENISQVNENLCNYRNFNRFKAIEIAKKQVMQNFNEWARNTNLISFHTGKGLEDTAEFGKFQWSFTSPSYVVGLKCFRSKVCPGFVLADALIGKKVTKTDVEPFIKKIDILGQQRNLPRFIPFLICDNLEEEAFKRVKSKGIFVGFIKELFGSTYSKVLRLLIETIADATKVITSNPDKFFELSEKISQLEGKFGNIKGDMFEFVVGYFYSLQHQPLNIGKIIKKHETGESKEIDIFITSNKQIKIVECKAVKSPLNVEYVKKYLDDNIPTIREWILSQDDYINKELIFELWSTSGFEEEALYLLQERANSVRPTKYRIEYFNKTQIKKKINETNNSKLKEIMKQYY